MATRDEPMQHTCLQIQLNCVPSTGTFDNIRNKTAEVSILPVLGLCWTREKEIALK
jgi:hypothetical protein